MVAGIHRYPDEETRFLLRCDKLIKVFSVRQRVADFFVAGAENRDRLISYFVCRYGTRRFIGKKTQPRALCHTRLNIAGEGFSTQSSQNRA